MDNSTTSSGEAAWRPLTSVQRRVFGVLMEKAKTTPDAYPMTLNALRTGANQKSNREPKMDLPPEQVEQALEELREMGAVAEVQGDGRVPKYRHYAYQWLGVDKEEMAVMAELLLRGEQTVGELRGRAARMEPIATVGDLQPILQRLEERKLVVFLTPAGRGQMLSHGLYQPRELEELQRSVAQHGGGGNTSPGPAAPDDQRAKSLIAELQSEIAELRQDVESLKQQVKQLREELR